MTVNFIAMRHLAELCADRMTEGGAIASISSTAGAGWLMNMDKWRPLLETSGFVEARAWCEANPEAIASGYAPSKEAIIMWTQWAGIEYAKRNVRLNCISPGPTDTPMMTDFENESGADLVDLFAQGAGRRSRPEEQAYPLIFLNSRAASYVSGENFNTDGGTLGALTTGSLVIDFSELLMGDPTRPESPEREAAGGRCAAGGRHRGAGSGVSCCSWCRASRARRSPCRSRRRARR